MTREQRSISNRYLLYKLFTNLWFLGAVWLYFYRVFITDQQVGVLDGFAFAIGLLAEVPSGALADKFGRDKLIRIGWLIAGSGLMLQALSSDFIYFFIGQAAMMVGFAFVSGADEALFFENLKFKKESYNWKRLLVRGSQIALIGTLTATVIGGWLHTINPRVPWIITALSFLFTVVVIWQIKDTRPLAKRQTFLSEIKDYGASIKEGFKAFSAPSLNLYVPVIITVQGLFYAVGFGLLRLVLLDRFTFSPLWGSVVVAVSGVVTVVLLQYMHKHADKLSEKWVISTVAISAVLGLFLSLADIGVWGFFVILALYAGEHLLFPFMSDILNYHTEEKQRATVLSVASFLRTLPYVILAPLIGSLSTSGNLDYFLIIYPFAILFALAYYLSRKKGDDIIETDLSL